MELLKNTFLALFPLYFYMATGAVLRHPDSRRQRVRRARMRCRSFMCITFSCGSLANTDLARCWRFPKAFPSGEGGPRSGSEEVPTRSDSRL